MKIFLSWSGTESKQLAEALRAWLPKVIQASKPWMSDEDIASGARWSNEIAGQLSDSSFGIICVNQANQANAWLQFESGALSKTVNQSFVVPYLHKIEPTEIVGPLSQFQANRTDKDGTLRMLQTINSALPNDRIEKEELEEIFEVWWPKLKDKIESIKTDSLPHEPKRTQEEMLEEMLELTRELTRKEDTRLNRSKEMDQKMDGFISMFENFAHEGSKKMNDTRTLISGLMGVNPMSLPISEMNTQEMVKMVKDLQASSKSFTQELEGLKSDMPTEEEQTPK